MKLSMTLLLALLCGASQARADAGVADLAWMAGHWQSADADEWSEEHWLAPRGDLMLGVNRSGSGESAKAFEFLRIGVDEDGVPTYWAAPGGSKAVPFRLREHTGTSALFVNPDHDYPREIRYRREGDRLTATISGDGGSNAHSWTWTRGD